MRTILAQEWPETELVREPRCRVTVIIIFHNEGRFLQEAIGSVLRQTYCDWELLLVDDGSTDGSTDLARRYAAQRLAPIRYVQHPYHANRGMSVSRNLGLTHARGEFVLFLDGDDVIVPNALDDQVTFMDAHPHVGTVYGPMRVWRSWDRQADGTPAQDSTLDLHLETERVHEPTSVLTTFLLHEDAVPSGNLFRTELVRKLGGFEDEFTGMYEDQVFRVKFCRVAPAYVSSRVWYHYRKHSDSCCALMVKQGKAAAARERFLRWVRWYCGREKVQDPRIWRTISRALRPYQYPRLAAVESRFHTEVRRWSGRMKDGVKDAMQRLLPKRAWTYLRDQLR